jgi:hypothetical protein
LETKKRTGWLAFLDGRPYGFFAKPDLTNVIAYHFSIRRMVSSSVSLLEDMTQIILTLSDIAPFLGTLVSLGAGRDTDLHFAAHLVMCIYF